MPDHNLISAELCTLPEVKLFAAAFHEWHLIGGFCLLSASFNLWQLLTKRRYLGRRWVREGWTQIPPGDQFTWYTLISIFVFFIVSVILVLGFPNLFWELLLMGSEVPHE